VAQSALDLLTAGQSAGGLNHYCESPVLRKPARVHRRHFAVRV